MNLTSVSSAYSVQKSSTTYKFGGLKKQYVQAYTAFLKIRWRKRRRRQVVVVQIYLLIVSHQSSWLDRLLRKYWNQTSPWLVFPQDGFAMWDQIKNVVVRDSAFANIIVGNGIWRKPNCFSLWWTPPHIPCYFMPGDFCSQHLYLDEVPVWRRSAGKTAAGSTTPTPEKSPVNQWITRTDLQSIKGHRDRSPGHYRNTDGSPVHHTGSEEVLQSITRTPEQISKPLQEHWDRCSVHHWITRTNL